jgi:hypothetical protein
VYYLELPFRLVEGQEKRLGEADHEGLVDVTVHIRCVGSKFYWIDDPTLISVTLPRDAIFRLERDSEGRVVNQSVHGWTRARHEINQIGSRGAGVDFVSLPY